MPVVELLIICIAGAFGGATSISYFVAIRSPNREQLEGFQTALPAILRWLYFSGNNAFLYDGRSAQSGIDYLLRERQHALPILVRWLILVLVFIGLYAHIIVQNYRRLGYVPYNFTFYYVAIVVLYARISFFGSSIGS